MKLVMMAIQPAVMAAVPLALWRLINIGIVISLAHHACPIVAGRRLLLPLRLQHGVWDSRGMCFQRVARKAAAALI